MAFQVKIATISSLTTEQIYTRELKTLYKLYL